MNYQTRHQALLVAGIGCILIKLGSVTIYYANAYIEMWGVLQKLSFVATTTWLIAVLLTSNVKTNSGVADECAGST